MTEEKEDLGNGVFRERLHEGKIVRLTAYHSGRAAVDTWVKAVLETANGVPPGGLMMLLHDFTHANLSLSPYGQRRTMDMVKSRPEVRGYAAMIIPRTVMGQGFRLFLGMLPSRGMERQVFFTPEEGLAWLERKLAAYEAGQAPSKK